MSLTMHFGPTELNIYRSGNDIVDCQLWVCWCGQTDEFKLNLNKKEQEKKPPL